jgi:hypothetical protein
MSEYQYYEFQAVDRSLTREQMAELRAISSRAEITPTHLTNVYHYGDFRGDPIELIVGYFDAHVYEANWGSHTLMFGFPHKAVDLKQLNGFRVEAVSDYEAGLMVNQRGDRVIVTFASHEEEYEGWIDEGDSKAWLPSLISLRADIMNGDLRALYLGWLAGATLNADAYDEVDDEDADEDEDAEGEFENADLLEPPVPAGLGQLTAPLKRLAEFLRLNPATIEVAAERSTPLKETRLSAKAVSTWIAALPSSEKDDLLLRLIQGEAQVGAELVRRVRADLSPEDESAASGKRRTAGFLARAGQERAAELERRAEAKKAKERSAYLDTLVNKQGALWRQANDLADQKKAREYDEAVTLLADLHELAVRDGKSAAFDRQLEEFRDRHARKPALIDRLRKVKLAP